MSTDTLSSVRAKVAQADALLDEASDDVMHAAEAAREVAEADDDDNERDFAESCDGIAFAIEDARSSLQYCRE